MRQSLETGHGGVRRKKPVAPHITRDQSRGPSKSLASIGNSGAEISFVTVLLSTELFTGQRICSIELYILCYYHTEMCYRVRKKLASTGAFQIRNIYGAASIIS
jgi:hypothetical protein